MVVMRHHLQRVGEWVDGFDVGDVVDVDECGSGDVYGVGDGVEFWWYVGAGTSNQVTVSPPVSAPSAPQAALAGVGSDGQGVVVRACDDGGDSTITYEITWER